MQTSTRLDLHASKERAKSHKRATYAAQRLAAEFAPFVGSEDNALELVSALRAGARVVLATQRDGDVARKTTEFDVPTGVMSWMDVRIALALARDALAAAGVFEPRGEDLQVALVGGEIVARDGAIVRVRGVLQMRADGIAWGRIAYVTSPTARAHGIATPPRSVLS